MPATTPCLPCCDTEVETNIPGSPGLQGEQGPQGEQGEPGETPELLDFTVYAAGTVYAVTASPALMDFGTTDPSLTLGNAGRYLIRAFARFDAAAATFAASRDITTYVYGVTGSAPIANTTQIIKTPVITTATQTVGNYASEVIYQAANNNEVVQLWTSIGTIPSAGALNVGTAYIVAIRLGD